MVRSLAAYRDTPGPDRQPALDVYRPVDVAFKIVGTGSVGTRDCVKRTLEAAPRRMARAR